MSAPASLGAKEAVAGAAAGVTGTLLGFPLDTLKSRMQSAGSSGGLLHNAAAVARSGTVYRGVSSPLLSMTLLNTISFATYARTRDLVGLPASGGGAGDDAWWRVAAAGSLVAVPVTVVSTPFELLKLQQQLAPARYSGSAAAAVSVVRTHGISALFRGMGVNFTREAVFLGCYFTAYERIRVQLQAHGVAEGAAVPVAGGASLHCLRPGVLLDS